MAIAFTSWTRSSDWRMGISRWSGARPVGIERSPFAMKRGSSFAGESMPRNTPSAAATGREDSPDDSSVRRESMSGWSAGRIGTSGQTMSRTRTYTSARERGGWSPKRSNTHLARGGRRPGQSASTFCQPVRRRRSASA